MESPKEKHEHFEVPDLETTLRRHNNPHCWLQQDILQIREFQIEFVQNIIFIEDTIPQIEVFSHFFKKFCGFNYQLLWEQQDPAALIHFPQKVTAT